MSLRGAIAGLVLAAPFGAVAQDLPCRQALALGIDVSGSVDAMEYRLQLDGIAASLLDEEVRGAILSLPSAPLAIAVYEWSSKAYQREVLGWTLITDGAVLDGLVRRLVGRGRGRAPYSTAIGSALEHGLELLARAPDCWQHTIDISGDGKNNSGPPPSSVLRGANAPTVNALVVGRDAADGLYVPDFEIGELAAYFKANVIRGPDAFVETALGYGDYAAAMKRKLLREFTGLTISALP